MTAFRWVGRLLAADAIALLLIFVCLAVGKALEMELQPLKWPLMFYSGLMIMFLIFLSVLWLALAGAVALRERGKATH